MKSENCASLKHLMKNMHSANIYSQCFFLQHRMLKILTRRLFIHNPAVCLPIYEIFLSPPPHNVFLQHRKLKIFTRRLFIHNVFLQHGKFETLSAKAGRHHLCAAPIRLDTPHWSPVSVIRLTALPPPPSQPASNMYWMGCENKTAPGNRRLYILSQCPPADFPDPDEKYALGEY